MIQVVWEFVVREEARSRFERAYGPGGDWHRLFAGYPGFRGTTLLRESANPRRYLTIDRWETNRHRKEMRARAKAEYSKLDAVLRDWTESEAEVGIYTVVADAGGAGMK